MLYLLAFAFTLWNVFVVGPLVLTTVERTHLYLMIICMLYSYNILHFLAFVLHRPCIIIALDEIAFLVFHHCSSSAYIISSTVVFLSMYLPLLEQGKACKFSVCFASMYQVKCNIYKLYPYELTIPISLSPEPSTAVCDHLSALP